jgi:cobaltochelatase CobS
MTTATQSTFDLTGLDKGNLIALARECGLRRDWARVKTAEIRAMLLAVSFERLHRALKVGGLSESQAQALIIDADAVQLATDDDAHDDKLSADDLAEYLDADEVSEAVIVPATQQVAAKVAPTVPQAPPTVPAKGAPDVAKLAAMLAQFMTTPTVDAEQVGVIVDAKLDGFKTIVGNAVATANQSAVAEVLETVSGWIKEAVNNMPARELVITTNQATITVSGAQHKNFETLLQLCAARQYDGHRLNVWIYGPPGTGKTTAARNVAKALSMPFYCNGSIATKYELIGFVDAHGKLVRTPFRDAWENGGVYLFDEADGSVAAAFLAFNAALANGVMAFPDGMIERHPDCVILAGANTTGLGATGDFTGRSKLDAASVDRFVFAEWPIDEALELAIGGNREWTHQVQKYRRKVAEKGFKGVQITPRASIYGATLLAQGVPLDAVKTMVVRKGMSPEQWASIN